jgi:hypothetical protein
MLLLPFLNIEHRATVEHRVTTRIKIQCLRDERGRILKPVMAAIGKCEKAAPAGEGLDELE